MFPLTRAFSRVMASAMSTGPAVFSHTRTLRVRRGHGGLQQAAKNIERQALLEQALEKPTRERAAEGADGSTHATASRETAAFLRSLPERVAAVRHQQHHGRDGDDAVPDRPTGSGFAQTHEGTHRDAGADDTLDEHGVVSLAHFLASCKQHRLDVGGARQADERRRRRQRYRAFWEHNVGSAVRCCQPSGGRDFSFLALHGLADDALHMDFDGMVAALRVLDQERPISSCMDMTRSLQYLARELAWMEKQQHQQQSHSELQWPSLPEPGALRQYRRSLTDLAVERISFFFLENAPAKNPVPLSYIDSDKSRTGGAPVFSPGALLGTGEDAISALEALTVLNVSDLSPAVAEALATRISAAEQAQYERHRQFRLDQMALLSTPPERGIENEKAMSAMRMDASVSLPSPPSVVHTVTQWLLVSRTFCFAAHEHRQLSFTSVVQGFALLRIFLPALWPPYGPRVPKSASAASPQPRSSRTMTNLGDEKDALQRICWGLAVALKKGDRRFTNPYHFVKITATLAKLPSFVLSPSPASRSPPQRHRQGSAKTKANWVDSTRAPSACSSSPSTSARDVVWTAEAFWSFVVAKACIFIPSLPLAQRRLVCRALDLAIREKRGRLLGPAVEASSPTPFDGAPTTAAAHDTSVLVDLQDTAEDILLPLVEDMSTLEENYDVALQRARDGDRNHGASRKTAHVSPQTPKLGTRRKRSSRQR